MGSLVGHVAPGFGFLLIGLWHLFNHIKLHAVNPKSYISLPWFPALKFKYLELFLIMGGSSASITMELFISPQKHQPFDTDGTIPTNHLHTFEHSSISLTFFFYAAFAVILDRIGARAQYDLTQLLGAVGLAQELFLFHLHSTDHVGPEGQFHLLLQLIVLVSLITTLMGIGMPKSFLVSFVRSLSIAFQGVWLIVMGYVLWTPALVPKGCFMHLEDGHYVVRCSGQESLYRAKALVNIQFSWFLNGLCIFAITFYLALLRIYGVKFQYKSLPKYEEYNNDLESQKDKLVLESSPSFIQMGKTFSPINMER